MNVWSWNKWVCICWWLWYPTQYTELHRNFPNKFSSKFYVFTWITLFLMLPKTFILSYGKCASDLLPNAHRCIWNKVWKLWFLAHNDMYVSELTQYSCEMKMKTLRIHLFWGSRARLCPGGRTRVLWYAPLRIYSEKIAKSRRMCMTAEAMH